MRVNIFSCLFVFVLGCDVTAGISHRVLEEKKSVSLRCPQSVEGEVTWSRETNGHKVDLLKIDGEREIRHNDPLRRFGSSADKSLHIRSVTVSDTGRYFCNDEAAVDLTVIPSGTDIFNVPEKAAVRLICRHDVGGSDVPSWSRGGRQIDGRRVSRVNKTLTINELRPRDSGLYYCDGTAAAYLNVSRVKASERGTKATATPATPIPPPPPPPPPTTTRGRTTPPPTPATPIPPPPPTTTTRGRTTPPPTPATPIPPIPPIPPPIPPIPSIPPIPPITPITPIPPPATATTSTTTTTTKKKTSTTTAASTTTTTSTPGTKTDHQNPAPNLLHRIALPLLLVLLILIIIIIITITLRRRFKRQGTGEGCNIYDEIQEESVPQPTNARPNLEDNAYSTICDIPLAETRTGTHPPNESPYSVIDYTFIGANNKGPSQPSDSSTYSLLQRPKTP